MYFVQEIIDDLFFELIADYHNHMISCTRTPTDIEDAIGLQMSCLATYGGPINPNVAIGSFDGKNFMNGTHAVITIPGIRR